MGAVPKKKHSKQRSKTRRSSRAIKMPHLSRCPSCKKLKRSHQACPHCGFYK